MIVCMTSNSFIFPLLMHHCGLVHYSVLYFSISKPIYLISFLELVNFLTLNKYSIRIMRKFKNEIENCHLQFHI